MKRQAMTSTSRCKRRNRGDGASEASVSAGAYSHVRYQHRSKILWAGVGIGNAFNYNLDYHSRLDGQKLFYRTLKKVQKKAAQIAGFANPEGFQAIVKPQLSPCYTQYPPMIAAYAAIGLTAFLEFSTRVQKKILMLKLDPYLRQLERFGRFRGDASAYRKIALMAAEYVQIRLLYEDLSRNHRLTTVEMYRLFSADRMPMRFGSLPEIIRCVVLFGDVMPDWRSLKPHPFAEKILMDLTRVCGPYYEAVGRENGQKLVDVGVRWVQSLCAALLKYLPDEPAPAPKAAAPDHPHKNPGISTSFSKRTATPRFSPINEPNEPDWIAPLDGSGPPSLFEPQNTLQQVTEKLSRDDRNDSGGQVSQAAPVSKETQKVLNDFASAVEKAGGQHSAYEDMRSDILEKTLSHTPFKPSPIEGNPVEGHEVRLDLGGDRSVGGEIFDRPVELSDNLPAYEALVSESEGFTRALERSLYPNFQQMPEVLKLKTVGSLDHARICLFEFSPAVFKRYRSLEKVDMRGNPLLVIACDGSGSLNAKQMQLLKLLAAGWLNGTVRTRIEILAGLYHSGAIRPGVSGPLVQWLYHPRKTPAIGRKDAARALVSLPFKGTGAQSDALSLGFILSEAKQIARGGMVYMILISDTAWNKSFRESKSGFDEVHACFESAYEEFEGKLHTTLVALGVADNTGLEDMLDQVIRVSAPELENHAAVAEKIGLYVAECMRQHQLLKAQNGR